MHSYPPTLSAQPPPASPPLRTGATPYEGKQPELVEVQTTPEWTTGMSAICHLI